MEPKYNENVEALRASEYPHMNNGTYLDHSGTTIYAKSLIDRFSRKMLATMYGNPHSSADEDQEDTPASLSAKEVDQVREKTLRFLGADPEEFDLIFVANATAAVKLVAESFRDLAEKTRSRGFWYGYHNDCHTSLVGVRELASGQSYCFQDDGEVELYLEFPQLNFANRKTPGDLGLFAYPGQSNMNGRRLPISWAGRYRQSAHFQNTYTLFDAAALAMTSSLESVFRNVDQAPDFTCLSFYKIFGFPNLGGLVVRRQSGHILALRKYFGGGTVTMVSTLDKWHQSKGLERTHKLHEGLEDGTLPFHSIMALGLAIDVHKELYGSMDAVSAHATYLSTQLRRDLLDLRHDNGAPVCRIYSGVDPEREGSERQGPVIAFNVMKADGTFIPYMEVEKAASKARFFIRSGGVCNPGGMASALGYNEAWKIGRLWSAGHQCGGGENVLGLVNSVPTGIVRASIGAMTTRAEVDSLIDFVRDTFVEAADLMTYDSQRSTLCSMSDQPLSLDLAKQLSRVTVEAIERRKSSLGYGSDGLVSPTDVHGGAKSLFPYYSVPVTANVI